MHALFPCVAAEAPAAAGTHPRLRLFDGGFEFFGGHIGDADGRLDLTFGNASLFRHLRLRQRKEGALLFHMIATPIELLQQLAHAANRARLNSVGELAQATRGSDLTRS